MGGLFERVVGLLVPYLGGTAARASVRMFLDKAGLTPESLSEEHLPKLASLLAPGLRVFIGPSKTELVVTQINALREGSAK